MEDAVVQALATRRRRQAGAPEPLTGKKR